MPAPFEMAFMRQALLAGIMVSVACGVIGSFVVARRSVFLSGGIAHAAYGGVGLGFWLRYGLFRGNGPSSPPGMWPLAGALFFSLSFAVITGLLTRRDRHRLDTVTGVLWAVGMATGVLLIDITPGYKADPMSFLFGSILTVMPWELTAMAVLNGLLISVSALFFRPLQAVGYDETFSEVRNMPVTGLNILFLCMVALSVVMMMRVVGLIMVIALLAIPAAISGMFVRRLSTMIGGAVALGVLFTTAGLLAAWKWNVTSGAAVILSAGVCYAGATALKAVLGSGR